MQTVKAAFPASAEWQLVVQVETGTPSDQRDQLWSELIREMESEQMARHIRDLQPEGAIAGTVFIDGEDGTRNVLFEREHDFLEAKPLFASAAS